MSIQLTTYSATEAFAALSAFDAARPDGLAKEILARAAALGLVKGLGNAGYLCGTYDLFATFVEAAAKAGAGVVNAAVKRLVFLDAVANPSGGIDADAMADLAGCVYDVVNGKALAVTQPPAPAPADKTLFDSPPAAASVNEDLAGLDLGSPDFAALRYVLTRTFKSVRPQVYQNYRALKDSGAATAKADAYVYVFGALAKLIEEAEAKYGTP